LVNKVNFESVDVRGDTLDPIMISISCLVILISPPWVRSRIRALSSIGRRITKSPFPQCFDHLMGPFSISLFILLMHHPRVLDRGSLKGISSAHRWMHGLGSRNLNSSFHRLSCVASRSVEGSLFFEICSWCRLVSIA